MVHYILSFILVFTPAFTFAVECKEDHLIQKTTDQCQMSYYKFAPSCKFGDGLCLSLVLQGLVNKNLFDYRPELRRVYNTPLKRRVFKRTSEYKSLYREMAEDLREAQNVEFCAEMDVYWLYDTNHNGFTFSPHTLIPKGKLFRYTSNVSRVGSYDLLKVPEDDAIEIESWETLNNMKIVFFTLSKGSGYVNVRLQRFMWFTPTISYDLEGTIQISHEEGCRVPSYYQYKVVQ